MKLAPLLLALGSALLTSCDPGQLRAFNDAMDESNGYEVVYDDQSSSGYSGDVMFTTGVRSGEGFQEFKNTGGDYCKVKVILEDGSYDVYYLDPYESTNRMYMSLYNQLETVRVLSHSTPDVFDASFD